VGCQDGGVSGEPNVIVGERFVDAVAMATRLHAHQTRKGSTVPYLSHLLAVAGLVLENGGDEDQAIAALLHDGPEDQGGEATLAEIGDRFGPRVQSIVAACSDTFETPKPPWQARKERYITHVIALTPAEGADVWPVSLADKVHNARTIVSDLRELGPVTLDGSPAGAPAPSGTTAPCRSTSACSSRARSPTSWPASSPRWARSVLSSAMER
jgi:hypothetical protein